MADQRVAPSVRVSDGTTLANQLEISAGGAASTNLENVGGNAVATGAAGVQKVAISDSTGQAITRGQQTMTNSVPVTLASDQTALPISVGTPTNPGVDTTNLTTPISLAAGASANADSADLPAKKLRQMVVSGSVDFKVILSTLANGVATPKVCLFGSPRSPVVYEPPHENFVVAGSTAGADGFRAALTNEDPTETADFYVSFFYCD